MAAEDDCECVPQKQISKAGSKRQCLPSQQSPPRQVTVSPLPIEDEALAEDNARKLEAPTVQSEELVEPAVAEVSSGVATPTWENITVEQLLDWEESFSPFSSYGSFLCWKEKCAHGLNQMATTTLVGGSLNMDYCYHVLGESQTTFLLRTGCSDQYGRAVPVTELC